VGGVVFGTTPAGASESNASSRINVTDNSELGLPRAVIRMACSKGTYVRAFARDLGEALNSGAHLDYLQRSRSGEFKVENALTVEQVMDLLAKQS
jgi:tRNA pseudouridine55 synthase